jgi:hypothetical protein
VRFLDFRRAAARGFPTEVADRQLAKLCGWDAPTKVEVETGAELTGLLGRLFGQGATLGGKDAKNPGDANS